MKVEIKIIDGIPRINKKCKLPEILNNIIKKQNIKIKNNDILVIAQKIVSKAEDRIVCLSDVKPGNEAIRVSKKYSMDSQLVELILQESECIVRARTGVIITKHKLGFVSANAGIDRSNAGNRKNVAILLPEDPDRSALEIKQSIENEFNKKIGVIINDSHGRPFRMGAVGVAIGSAGIKPLKSYIGRKDLYGYTMKSSREAIADEIASAATLLMGQSNEGRPVVIVRGFDFCYGDFDSSNLIRESTKDLFLKI